MGFNHDYGKMIYILEKILRENLENHYWKLVWTLLRYITILMGRGESYND